MPQRAAMSDSTFHRRIVWGVFPALAVLLFCLPGVARAQALEGQVRDNDRQPLLGVNVFIPALQRGAVTDEAGRYVIPSLPAGTHTVEFRFVGFKTVTRAVTLAVLGAVLGSLPWASMVLSGTTSGWKPSRLSPPGTSR